MRFANKIVAIMGAGSTPVDGWGNGRASAVAFAREGATVIALDLHFERAEETARLIVAEGLRCVAVQANATQEASVTDAVAQILRDHGRIDVLQNNVGVGGDPGAIERTSEKAFDREFAVNAKSVFLGMKAVLPAMIRQGGGAIINTSSTLAARFIEAPSFSYTAAKAAVEAMTRSVAVSHGHYGIRVNCIRIGFMDTPLNRAGWQGVFKDREKYDAVIAASARSVPMGRMGTGFDTAAAALFLASDEASYMNGVILPVDGGVEHAPVYIHGLLGAD